MTGDTQIFSNKELKKSDIIIPNTFISKSGETIFIENTIWKDYDMNKFWLMLSWICSDNKEEKQEFQADIFSQNIFIYLNSIDSEKLLEKTIVISQIEEQGSYSNLVAVTDMMI